MRLVKLLVLIVVAAGLFSCNSKFNKIQKSKDLDYKLAKANEYFDKKKYKNASILYESLFPVYKGSQKFEDLYYRQSYCYFHQHMYPEAENWFKGFLEVFPNSSRAEEVAYMRALSFHKQSPRLELEQVNTVKSMKMMQDFISTYPGSPKVKEATVIIDESRAKLERKEFRSAELYYNLGHYRAAAIAFTNLMNNYPESLRGEDYKLLVVKSFYRFAKMSMPDKQIERYEKVISEYDDFVDRYPDSKLLKTAEEYANLSRNNIKQIQNEQIASSTK